MSSKKRGNLRIVDNTLFLGTYPGVIPENQLKVQSSKFKVQSSKLKAQDSKLKGKSSSFI